MFIFLALQSLIFAAWAVVSAGILLNLAGRMVSRQPTSAEGVVMDGLLRGYLADPETALRRKVWVGLTAALAVCVAISVWTFSTL